MTPDTSRSRAFYQPRRTFRDPSAQALAVDRLAHRAGRQRRILAGADHDPDQRSQCRHSLRFQLQLERPAGNPVVPVRRRFPALLALYAAEERACPHRRPLRQALAARSGGHRHHRHPLFPAADGRVGALAFPAADRRVLQDQRALGQRRRPDPLAGQDPAADRLHAAGPAGHFRTDQAHRLPGRDDRRSRTTRKKARRPKKNWPPPSPPPKPQEAK